MLSSSYAFHALGVDTEIFFEMQFKKVVSLNSLPLEEMYFRWEISLKDKQKRKTLSKMLEKIFPSTEGFDRKIIHMETTLFKVRYKIPQATRKLEK